MLELRKSTTKNEKESQVPTNKYANLPETHYPIVHDQIIERINALQQAIDSVRESMESQIKLLEQQKTEAEQDLNYIKSRP